jgi:hypothetical protein
MLAGFVTNDMSERAALGSSYVLLEELIRIIYEISSSQNNSETIMCLESRRAAKLIVFAKSQQLTVYRFCKTMVAHSMILPNSPLHIVNTNLS